MIDHLLPLPDPDWDNPTPIDAPAPEEVDAYAALVRLRDGLTAWLGQAVGTSLLPVQWRRLVALLDTTAAVCAIADTDHIAEHDPGRITIHRHPAVPHDDACVRCGLQVDDSVHQHQIGPT